MSDLIHFVPLTETVTVRDNKIRMRGIELEDVGQIMFRFPELAQMIATRSFDVSKVLQSGQAAVALIAASAGHPGDDKAEKSFANLSLGEKALLLKSAIRLTMPGGIGPFVDLVLVFQPQNLPEVDGQPEPGGKIKLKARDSRKPRTS